MPRLDEHDLKVLSRPGDGACLYWSAGTGVGHYGENSFEINGVSNSSPIYNCVAPQSEELLRQMRADRNAVCDWLLRPENAYILRCEHDLWTKPRVSRKEYQMNESRETFSRPDGCTAASVMTTCDYERLCQTLRIITAC